MSHANWNRSKEIINRLKDLTIPEMMKALREEIAKHDRLYEQNQPIISDGEYDELYAKLVELEKQYPEYITPDSPTQRVITEIVSELEAVEHTTFMGSQEKVKTWEGIEEFLNRGTEEDEILIQYKLDGLTGVLRHNEGQYQMAISRGDGYTGENITHTVRTIQNIPHTIPFKNNLEVRMEIIIPYDEFERINASIEDPSQSYSNPRNLASGTVRQLDASIAKDRKLQGIVFDLVSAEGKTFYKDTEQIEFLKDQGFEVVPTKVFKNNAEGRQQMKEYVEQMENEIRSTLPYMIDGLVIKFNSLETRERLGSTSKHPKWSISYKFASLEATTKLLSVTNQVGKTGQITPVGKLQTVNIDGVNVSRASLHNYGLIKSKDIRVGDTVVVIRANDVIPHITKSIVSLRDGTETIIEQPTHCPSCGSPVQAEKDLIYCTGLNCFPQLKAKIVHFGSRQALNIEGLGEKTVETFMQKGFLKNFIDLYSLNDHREEILKIKRYGAKRFDNLLYELEKAKSAPLHKVIYAFSIRHIGESASREFAKHFNSMNQILEESKNVEAFKNKVLNIKDFGEESCKSVVDFFTNDKNREMIQELMSLGFEMKSEGVQEIKESTITGLTFVITGKLSKPRNEFKKIIEQLGGKVTGTVSSKTDYLLMGEGEEGSNKYQKALELDIPILSEIEFNLLISN